MNKLEILPDHLINMVSIPQTTFEYRTEKNYIPFGTLKDIMPEDRSLAIAGTPPAELCEIWYRFVGFNWHINHSSACIFNSYLLRRILKMHGFSCSVKQVIGFYHNPKRNWTYEVGNKAENQDAIVTGEIDTHAVVVSNGWILDFSMYRLYQKFGNTAPQAIIVPEEYDKWHDIGITGHIMYKTRDIHLDTKNELLTFKTGILESSQQYFHFYKA